MHTFLWGGLSLCIYFYFFLCILKLVTYWTSIYSDGNWRHYTDGTVETCWVLSICYILFKMLKCMVKVEWKTIEQICTYDYLDLSQYLCFTWRYISRSWGKSSILTCTNTDTISANIQTLVQVHQYLMMTKFLKTRCLRTKCLVTVYWY